VCPLVYGEYLGIYGRIIRVRGATGGPQAWRALKEIFPRGNNKVVILYFLIHDKGLLFMLELY
jgi:hypothetical protein